MRAGEVRGTQAMSQWPPALVLLHGWGATGSVFEPLVRALGPACRAHALDLPGYGRQPRCEPYTLEVLAEALAAAAPERCALVGWSLGAQLALAWARARPQQVVRLVLVAATPCFVRRPGWDAGLEAPLLRDVARALRLDPRAALLRFIGLQAHGEPRPRRVIEELRSRVQSGPLASMETLHDGLEILLDTDLREVLPQVVQPTLLVHGSRDVVIPPAAGAYLARELPRARLALLEDAGHAPVVSQPAAVARLIAEHLDE
jgi:pimeloyl-[acyl-carrier protein] methyl ester esterase